MRSDDVKIALCMIVKDDSELDDLSRALDSALEYVDAAYITANGEEVAGIKALCEQKGINYDHHPWSKSFAQMRNHNFTQVPEDEFDYIFWMDSDDILVGGEHLRELAAKSKQQKVDFVFLSYWYECAFRPDAQEKSFDSVIDIRQVQPKERLIRPGSLYWKNRLHETPVPPENSDPKYINYSYDEKERPIAILHTADPREMDDFKFERNKELMQLQYQDELEAQEVDPRTLLNLMKIYAEDTDESNLTKVLEFNKQYQQMSGWDQERGVGWEQEGIARGRLGDAKGAIECFHNAIREWPHQTLFYIRLAAAYYNVGSYEQASHWLETAGNMNITHKRSIVDNIRAIKAMYFDLWFRLYFYWKKDYKSAYEAAAALYQVEPNEINEHAMSLAGDLSEMNTNLRNLHELFLYLEKIEEENRIPGIVRSLPDSLAGQPMPIHFLNKHSEPRTWKDNEICYFANFGSTHFEKWSATSIDKGIGGSETAVIELTKRWAEMGYKVTVYGDPGEDRGEINGVTWLPWYHFNPNDKFNIFIQWRSWQLASQVNSKLFMVDMHDIYNPVDIRKEDLEKVDFFMLKSEYHKKLGSHKIPEEKVYVISNGISLGGEK